MKPLSFRLEYAWKLSCSLLAALGFVTASGPARAAEVPVPFAAPKRVVIPKLNGALVLDGILDEPVWRRAAVLKPFAPNDGKGAETEPTEVRLWYDDDALYIGWTCIDSDIQATFTERDSRFWEEEVVEFFVTAKELTRYFELQWNPLGGIFDAIITNELDARGVSRRIEGDWDYTATGMRSAVKVDGTVGDSSDKDRADLTPATFSL